MINENAGAAIATVIGNVAGAGYYILYFLRGKSSLSIHPKDFTLGDRVCSSVLAIGIPASLVVADECFPDCRKQPDGRLWRHGPCRYWCGNEGYHDDRHGLYRIWSGNPAAAGILRRGNPLGEVQEGNEFLSAVFFYPQRGHDRRMLPAYPSDCQRFSE